MDPLTHTLVSVTIGRAGLAKNSRLAMLMLVIAGTAADADWLAVLIGPEAYLAGHRTITHSILGTIALAAAVAALYFFCARKFTRAAISFQRAFLVCGAAAAAHLLMDVMNPYGTKLFWPISHLWISADVLPQMDFWILAILIAFLAVPWVFNLAAEEIGARKSPRAKTAAAALALVALFIFGRSLLHAHAVALMNEQLFHGETPYSLGALPTEFNPFLWTGIAETRDSMQVVNVPVMMGTPFSADDANVIRKPPASSVLTAATNTDAAQTIIAFARFPLAEIDKTEEGYEVSISDLQLELAHGGDREVTAHIGVVPPARVTNDELRFVRVFQGTRK